MRGFGLRTESFDPRGPAWLLWLRILRARVVPLLRDFHISVQAVDGLSLRGTLGPHAFPAARPAQKKFSLPNTSSRSIAQPNYLTVGRSRRLECIMHFAALPSFLPCCVDFPSLCLQSARTNVPTPSPKPESVETLI